MGFSQLQDLVSGSVSNTCLVLRTIIHRIRSRARLHNVYESTFLIFNEIFGSRDEERRNNLLTALRTHESRFPQILLFSHIAEMQGEFANTFMVEMGADKASRVKGSGVKK